LLQKKTCFTYYNRSSPLLDSYFSSHSRQWYEETTNRFNLFSSYSAETLPRFFSFSLKTVFAIHFSDSNFYFSLNSHHSILYFHDFGCFLFTKKLFVYLWDLMFTPISSWVHTVLFVFLGFLLPLLFPVIRYFYLLNTSKRFNSHHPTQSTLFYSPHLIRSIFFVLLLMILSLPLLSFSWLLYLNAHYFFSFSLLLPILLAKEKSNENVFCDGRKGCSNNSFVNK
jgi:hypothetical protein